MKNFFVFLMILVSSFNLYAQDINKMKEVKPLTEISNRALYPVLATVDVDFSDITLPWTFSVPAPTEDVDEIQGPVGPNTSYWTKQNGYLYITILERAEPQLMEGTYEFIVKTKNATYYSIILNIN